MSELAGGEEFGGRARDTAASLADAAGLAAGRNDAQGWRRRNAGALALRDYRAARQDPVLPSRAATSDIPPGLDLSRFEAILPIA